MLRGDRDLDTICAISTPPGRGGISVIRISGKAALSISKKIGPFLPLAPESHRAYFGLLKSQTNNEDIDEVVATYFQEGRSFTGEQTIEIAFHGSPVIANEILNELITAGARIADRGEFTYRAFMNGRLDLTQAESVLSLIESQSKQASKLALRQLRGSLSHELQQIEADLIYLLAHMEASIDFSTEGLEVISSKDTTTRLQNLLTKIRALLLSYKKGRALSAGFRVVFAGIPNVGKSSILNNILEENRAIVTEVPGTTRDLIEDQLMIEGALVRITDTAGFRVTEDVVEKIGVERSHEAVADADLVFYVFDLTQGLSTEDEAIIAKIPMEKLYLVGNKLDLVPESGNFFKNNPNLSDDLRNRILFVSALDKKAGSVLKEKIAELLKPGEMDEVPLVSQARHFEALNFAIECLERGLMLSQAQQSPEFMAHELKDALVKVQEILGKRFDDDIMDRVFKEFCLGK